MVRPLALLAFSGLVLVSLAQDGWELELATPAPVDAEITGPLADHERHECAGCHATIAAEWSQTLHAHAWVDPRYREGLEGKRRPQSCYGCHAPEPLHLAEEPGRRPAPRADDASRHFGVDCKSCHLGPDETVLGPWGSPTEAHVSVRSEDFVGTGSNGLCITCHRTNIGPVIGIARDFEEADLGGRGMSCVGCHMAPVRRAVATNAEGRHAPERQGRSHLLQTPRDPAFLAQAFELEARDEGGAVVVTIRNRAGHRVPGLVGRELRFEAELPDDDERASLVLDERAYLPLEGAVELRLAGAAPTVRIRGIHEAPHLDTPQVFLERELSVAP